MEKLNELIQFVKSNLGARVKISRTSFLKTEFEISGYSTCVSKNEDGEDFTEYYVILNHYDKNCFDGWPSSLLDEDDVILIPEVIVFAHGFIYVDMEEIKLI